MKARCYNKNNQRYNRYGGRGIEVCAAWRDNFLFFEKWAKANGYEDGLSIERIDVNSGYSPENCAWIPRSEQSRNQARTKRFGDGLLWLDVARANGVDNRNMYKRMGKLGWSAERATSEPSGVKTDRGGVAKMVDSSGRPFIELARENRIKASTFRNRVRRGWPTQLAATTPATQKFHPIRTRTRK